MGLLEFASEFLQALVNSLHISTNSGIVFSEGLDFSPSILTFFPEMNVPLLNPGNIKSDVCDVLMKQLLLSSGLVEGVHKLLKLGLMGLVVEFCFGYFPMMGSEDRPHPGNSFLQVLPRLL
jgi:hypothetical protein